MTTSIITSPVDPAIETTSGKVAKSKRLRLKKNGYQTIPHAIHEVLEGLSGHACKVYLLLNRMADGRRECWPGRDAIAQRQGFSEETTKRAIAELVKARLVSVKREQRYAAARYEHNVYTILDPKPRVSTDPEFETSGQRCGTSGQGQENLGSEIGKPRVSTDPIRKPSNKNKEQDEEEDGSSSSSTSFNSTEELASGGAFDQFLVHWNATPGLPRARPTDGTRKAYAGLVSDPEVAGAMPRALQNLRDHVFLHAPWCSAEWFLKLDNYWKVAEGQYAPKSDTGADLKRQQWEYNAALSAAMYSGAKQFEFRYSEEYLNEMRAIFLPVITASAVPWDERPSAEKTVLSRMVSREGTQKAVERVNLSGRELMTFALNNRYLTQAEGAYVQAALERGEVIASFPGGWKPIQTSSQPLAKHEYANAGPVEKKLGRWLTLDEQIARENSGYKPPRKPGDLPPPLTRAEGEEFNRRYKAGEIDAEGNPTGGRPPDPAQPSMHGASSGIPW